MTRQLALPFDLSPDYSAANFLPAGSNNEALAWLRDLGKWPALRLAIYGEPGSGKTHLLHVFAEQHKAVLMPCEAVRHLVDLPDSGAIAIDDADEAPEPAALLHLLNAAAERRLPVLLAGRAAPARWPACLPDLTSRLRAVTAVRLGQPDDDLLRALLARLIAERQLRVERPVQDYLLARLPRTGSAMRAAAACLDRVSLAAGGRVTRAIAAEVLARLGASRDDEVPQAEVSAPSPAQPSLI